MAQYWWHPNAADLNGPPAEFVYRGWGSGPPVKTVLYDAVIGRHYLEVDPSLSGVYGPRDDGSGQPFGTGATIWDAPANIELFVDMAFDHLGTYDNRLPAFLAARDISAGIYGDRSSRLVCGAQGGSGFHLYWSGSSLGSVSFNHSALRGRLLAYRMSAVEDQIKAKYWDKDNNEPAGWDIEVTNTSALPGAHSNYYCGLSGVDVGGIYRVYGLGIGTDGDPAPSVPLSVGAPVLSSAEATFILDTSVVPNMVQDF